MQYILLLFHGAENTQTHERTQIQYSQHSKHAAGQTDVVDYAKLNHFVWAALFAQPHWLNNKHFEFRVFYFSLISSCSILVSTVVIGND